MAEIHPREEKLLLSDSTAAVVLGASAWPRARGLNGGNSFVNSAREIKAYLQEPKHGLGLPEEAIFWLFDSNLPGPSQIDEIGSFLQKRERDARMLHGSSGLCDTFIYYVGHGSFPEASNQFFMLARTSDPDQWDTSCILASALARRVRSVLPFARQIVILDCCFSGAAIRDWQAVAGSQGVMMRASIEDSVPSTGAVLICSSASEMVSMAPAGASLTMFTDGLLTGLRKGNPALGRVLNARDAGDLAWSSMQTRWKGRAIRPVVVPVDRGHGDISRIGAFLNPAFPDFPPLQSPRNPPPRRLAYRLSKLPPKSRLLWLALTVAVLGSITFVAMPSYWGDLIHRNTVQPASHQPQDRDKVIEELAPRFSPERIADYFHTDDAVARSRKRDDIVFAKMAALDYEFSEWTEGWWRTNFGDPTGLPRASEGLAEARQTPAEVSMTFATKMASALFNQMQADRANIRNKIRDGLKKADSDYTLSEALLDLSEYQEVGSLPSATTNLSKTRVISPNQ
jgi:hypothetical protein